MTVDSETFTKLHDGSPSVMRFSGMETHMYQACSASLLNAKAGSRSAVCTAEPAVTTFK